MFSMLMDFNYDDYNGQEYQDRPWNVRCRRNAP
jgi:hypothetical protein